MIRKMLKFIDTPEDEFEKASSVSIKSIDYWTGEQFSLDCIFRQLLIDWSSTFAKESEATKCDLSQIYRTSTLVFIMNRNQIELASFLGSMKSLLA